MVFSTFGFLSYDNIPTVIPLTETSVNITFIGFGLTAKKSGLAYNKHSNIHVQDGLDGLTMKNEIKH